MIISARLSECIRQVPPVDDRILLIRLKLTCGLMTAVAVYTPPEDHELRDWEQFYLKLDSVVRCRSADVIVVLGDFNADTGSDRVGYESCLVPQDFGVQNENSQFTRNWGFLFTRTATRIFHVLTGTATRIFHVFYT